jgi:hypothetical protein
MARASLLGLKNELQVCASRRDALNRALEVIANGTLDLLGLMTYYHENGFWSQFQGGAHYVRDQRQAHNLVENLGALRFHAGS